MANFRRLLLLLLLSGCTEGRGLLRAGIEPCGDVTSSDVNNCGACGRVCAQPANEIAVCEDSICRASCAPGFADCHRNSTDGCETDVGNDTRNCGSCGKRCPLAAAGQTVVCKSGVCKKSCSSGFADCNGQAADGCEVSTATDIENCGGCGKNCTMPNAKTGCVAGSCNLVACESGFADCDSSSANGCESNLQTDLNHCGQCGHVCDANLTCWGGLCQSGCLLGGKVPPASCFKGMDPFTPVHEWVICQADCASAWISHATPYPGGNAPGDLHFHASRICQDLGYSTLKEWGGTCGGVCGYCNNGSTCSTPGTKTFDRAGQQAPDANGPVLGLTVMWLCAL